jgi:hypothetical protein
MGETRALVSYLGKMTGLSRAQVTRLITQYRRRRFATLYTPADVAPRAEVDEATRRSVDRRRRRLLSLVAAVGLEVDCGHLGSTRLIP